MTAIERLAVARDLLAFNQSVLKAREAEFAERTMGERDDVAQARKEVEDAEAEVKAQALAAFEADGTKKGDGTEIKMFAKLDYPEASAFAWAKESGLALALDKKAFEKIAGATDLDFVTKRTEPKVTIASDLSSFLH